MKSSPITYMVITGSNIGGAEKRLMSLWLELAKNHKGQVKAILSQELYDKLISIKEFEDLPNFKSEVIFDLVSQNYRSTMDNIYNFAQKLPENQQFHFVLSPPLKKIKNHQTFYTFPSSSFEKLNWKGLLGVFNAFYIADKIDILDPGIFQLIKKIFLYKSSSVLQTPGSFVDSGLYNLDKSVEKENIVVFSGLLSRVKQAEEALRAVPQIDKNLKEKEIHCKFIFMGRETNEFSVDSIISSSEFEGVDIEVGFKNNPQEVLKKAKIFLSLQRKENYPSKSLLEAMSCGCVPVVTQVGFSHLIAKEQFAEYVPERFTGKDLAQACLNILKESESSLNRKRDLMKSHIEEKFTFEKSYQYFSKMYGLS